MKQELGFHQVLSPHPNATPQSSPFSTDFIFRGFPFLLVSCLSFPGLCLEIISPVSPLCAVQALSRVRLFATPLTAARQASPSFTISRSLRKLMPVELVMLQPSCPLSSPSPPPFGLSQHQGLCQWVSSSHQVAKALELCVYMESVYTRSY